MLLTYQSTFGNTPTTGTWAPLDKFFTYAAAQGWAITSRIGVFCALIEIVMVAVHLYLNGTNSTDRAEGKQRLLRIIIVSCVMVNLVAIVGLIERAVGVDF